MGKDAIPHLLVGLKDSNERVRSACVDALGKIGDSSVARAVAEHVTDLVFPSDVPKALGGFGAEGASAIIHVVLTRADLPSLSRTYLCEAFREIGPAGVVPLRAALAKSNPDQREFVIRALGLTKAPEAAQDLLAYLDDATDRFRRAAVCAFGDLQDEKYVDVILQTMEKHLSPLMEADGCIALAQLEVEPATQCALEMLENGFPDLGLENNVVMQRYVAARALQANLQAATPVLEKLISKGGGDAPFFTSMLHGLNAKRQTEEVSNPHAVSLDEPLYTGQREDY